MSKKKNRRYKKKPRRTRKMRDRHEARLEKQRQKANVYVDEEEIQEERHQEMKQKYPLALRLCVYGNIADSRYFDSEIEYSYVTKKFLGMNLYSAERTIGECKFQHFDEIDKIVRNFRRIIYREYPDYTLVYFADVSRKMKREFKEKLSGLLTPTKTLKDKLVIKGLSTPPEEVTRGFF